MEVDSAGTVYFFFYQQVMRCVGYRHILLFRLGLVPCAWPRLAIQKYNAKDRSFIIFHLYSTWWEEVKRLMNDLSFFIMGRKSEYFGEGCDGPLFRKVLRISIWRWRHWPTFPRGWLPYSRRSSLSPRAPFSKQGSKSKGLEGWRLLLAAQLGHSSSKNNKGCKTAEDPLPTRSSTASVSHGFSSRKISFLNLLQWKSL